MVRSFFGDDPKLVTRNVRADMVDKIQVFDKASDKDKFIGIDTSPKTRTINVQLKEDKKNGLFGKMLAGAGTDGYYQGQAMVNRFKQNLKFATYGTIANNGKNRLSSADFGSLGASNINLPKKGLVTVGGQEALENYNGEFNGDGFPLAHNLGAHYSNKWNGNKSSINTDVQLGHIQVKGNSETQIQQNLNEGTLNTVVKEDFDNRSFKTKLNGGYKYNEGSNFFSLGVVAGLENFDLTNTYNSTSLTESGALVNDQNRSVINKGDHNAVNLNAYYGKKFKKEKRNLGLSLAGNANAGNTHGFLRSDTKFADDASVEKVDQLKTSDIENSSVSYIIEYIEPIAKYMTMTLRYGMEFDQSKANRKSFNYTEGAGYSSLDSVFSNNYHFSQFGNTGGIRFIYNKDNKLYLGLGTDVSSLQFKQENFYTQQVYNRNFLNWTPNLYMSYKLENTANIRVSYNGVNSQPTLEQIQPVSNNADPLYIRIGNPLLRPSFENKTELIYHYHSPVSGIFTMWTFKHSSVQKGITNAVSTDIATGNTTIGYVNLNDRSPQTYALIGSLSKTLFNKSLDVSLNINISNRVSYSFINEMLNSERASTYRGGLSLYCQKPNKFQFQLGYSPEYTVNRMSQQKQFNNNANGSRTSGGFKVFLPSKLEIESNAHYSYRGQTAVFEDFQQFIWNASVAKKMLKGQNLKLALSAHDLLNQSQRFDRSIAGNTFRQYTAAVIQRYFMVSLTWDFTKFGTLPQ